MNMMKWPFKVFSEDPTLQGPLRTLTTALYCLVEGEKREQGRNRKRTLETASKREADSKTKMQKSHRGWDKQRNPHREKENQNESKPKKKKKEKKLLL